MEIAIRNVIDFLRTACEKLEEELYVVAIENAFFASELAVKLLCEYAFENRLIGKLPESHRGRQNVLTVY